MTATITYTLGRFVWRELLTREHGCHAVVDNDVNIMAVGERHGGVAHSVDDFLFIKIGTGIGCGIYLGGEVYRGTEYTIDVVPKTRIEVLCEAYDAEDIANVIVTAARSGRIGDGVVLSAGLVFGGSVVASQYVDAPRCGHAERAYPAGLDLRASEVNFAVHEVFGRQFQHAIFDLGLKEIPDFERKPRAEGHGHRDLKFVLDLYDGHMLLLVRNSNFRTLLR